MTPSVALIVGSIFAVAAVVLLYVFVLPKKKDGQLKNRFLQWMHDFFHFKTLYLEIVSKFLYVLGTAFCICYGFFLMLSSETYYSTSYYYGYGEATTTYYAIPGLCYMILGPIALRLAYELLMMTILLVRNVMDINNKLGKKPEQKEIPAQQEAEKAE